MMNVRIHDNGAAFLVRVNGLTVAHFNTLGNAWRHIDWMYAVESQNFTVGQYEIPVKVWLHEMKRSGFLDTPDYGL